MPRNYMIVGGASSEKLERPLRNLPARTDARHLNEYELNKLIESLDLAPDAPLKDKVAALKGEGITLSVEIWLQKSLDNVQALVFFG